MPLFTKKKSPTRRLPLKSSRRAPITTYYRAVANKNPSPFKPKPVAKSHRKLWLGATDVLLVGLLVFLLFYSLGVNQRPKVMANSWVYHSPQAYQAAAAAQLADFKNHNKLTFDESSVTEALQKQFPEIRSAQVELPFFSQKPTLRLDIAPPAFKLSSGGQVYVIDSTGVVVARTADLPAVKNLPTVNDQSGFPITVDKRILSSSAVSFITTIQAECRRARIPIASLTLPPLPQEIDLRTTDQPYFVKFYLDGDALTQAGQFLAARAQFAQNHQSPAQYLDVRVAGKIFYK